MAGFQNKVGTLTLMKWPDDALGKFFALIDTLLLFADHHNNMIRLCYLLEFELAICN